MALKYVCYLNRMIFKQVWFAPYDFPAGFFSDPDESVVLSGWPKLGDWICFVLTRPRHVPTARPGALMESAFVLAATIGPGPSHHPHGTLLSNRRGGGLLRLESGKVEGIYKACRQRTRPSARGLGCGDGALEVPLCLCALCVVAS